MRLRTTIAAATLLCTATLALTACSTSDAASALYPRRAPIP